MGLRRGAGGEYLESTEEKAERFAFEVANPYKVGDQVIILKRIIPNGQCPYLHQVAKVESTKTSPGSGPCFRIKYGGNGINIFDKNEVCFDDPISRYLYV